MMTEKWTKWEPIGGISGKYKIESIVDTGSAFTIRLMGVNDGKMVQVVFEPLVDVYRCTNRLYASKYLSFFEKQCSDFANKWTFFKVSNSEYVNWVREQSCGIYDDWSFTHFVLMDDELMLDVVTTRMPLVELVQ